MPGAQANRAFVAEDPLNSVPLRKDIQYSVEVELSETNSRNRKRYIYLKRRPLKSAKHNWKDFAHWAIEVRDDRNPDHSDEDPTWEVSHDNWRLTMQHCRWKTPAGRAPEDGLEPRFVKTRWHFVGVTWMSDQAIHEAAERVFFDMTSKNDPQRQFLDVVADAGLKPLSLFSKSIKSQYYPTRLTKAEEALETRRYNVFFNNCQDFAKRLGRAIKQPDKRKREWLKNKARRAVQFSFRSSRFVTKALISSFSNPIATISLPPR